MAGQEVLPAGYLYDNILSVAATDQNDNLAGFSNWGATSVDMGAPGDDILTTFANGGYGLIDGTSFAAPMVAGAAALALSLNPDLTVADLKAKLMSTGDAISSLAGKTVSGKRLNTLELMRSVRNGSASYILGDHEGMKRADDFLIRVSPSNATRTQVLRWETGTGYKLEKTVSNDAATKISIYGIGENDFLTVQSGVLNSIVGGGGDGNDTFNASGTSGPVTLVGGLGDDTLTGGSGNDYLEGSAGNDYLYGHNGNDTLNGVGGNDYLHGGRGHDNLFGGAGNDFFARTDDGFTDLIDGGSGTDTLEGGLRDSFDTLVSVEILA